MGLSDVPPRDTNPCILIKANYLLKVPSPDTITLGFRPSIHVSWQRNQGSSENACYSPHLNIKKLTDK